VLKAFTRNSEHTTHHIISNCHYRTVILLYRTQFARSTQISTATLASIEAVAQCRISDQLKYDAWNYIPVVVGHYLMAIQFTFAP
jgi:hypothetical protein